MRCVSTIPDRAIALSAFAPPADGLVHSLHASVTRVGEGDLVFRYTLHAMLDRLHLPTRSEPCRAEGLWKHTCFEAFILRDAGPGYCELNFSPSGQWAAYSFDRYREGMTDVPMSVAPDIRLQATSGHLSLDARIESRTLWPVDELSHPAKLRIALAAVIEDRAGHLSYWALKHAPARPDFHDPAGFILEV